MIQEMRPLFLKATKPFDECITPHITDICCAKLPFRQYQLFSPHVKTSIPYRLTSPATVDRIS